MPSRSFWMQNALFSGLHGPFWKPWLPVSEIFSPSSRIMG
jgi:hypothetical protein